MKFRYLCAVIAVALLSGQAHGQAGKNLQSCEGTIGTDKDGQMQLTDIRKNPSLWCDAYIGMDKNDEIAKRVLAQCPMGSRCVIEGIFAGRGVFYWTKIISANLKQKETTIGDMKGDMFRMPSGQIHCMFVTSEGKTEPNGIACDVNATFIRTPVRPRPKDCEYDWGQRFELGNDSDADLACASDWVGGENSTVLAYGKSVRLGKIVCSSEQTGLTCRNAKGHGFFLSRASQKIF